MGTKAVAASSRPQFQISLLEEVLKKLNRIDPELYDPIILTGIISNLQIFEDLILELFAQNQETFAEFNSLLSQRKTLSMKQISLEGLGNEALHKKVKDLLTDLMKKRLPKDKPPAAGSLDTLRDALTMVNIGDSGGKGLKGITGDEDDKWPQLYRPRSPLDPHPVNTVPTNGVVKSADALRQKPSIAASTYRVQIVVKRLLDLLKKYKKAETENDSLRTNLFQMTRRAEEAEKRVQELESRLPIRL